jgi:hypothetical protein|tara:strand:+ start:96 stop:401 length:306 start_codon:yes stop_codon:yes gene_type:complete
MYYGYDQDTPFWKEERKVKLHQELNSQLELKSLGDVTLLRPRPLWMMETNKKPYLEINSFGRSGVCIRKITHLSKEERRELVNKMDRIYREVMKDDDEVMN